MKSPRYQFTLLQMMVLVAFCAISLALLTTYASLLVPAIWIPLLGILIDGARGGDGVVGGTVAGGFGAVAFMFVFATVIHDGPPAMIHPVALILSCLLFMPFGLIFGAVVSLWIRYVELQP